MPLTLEPSRALSPFDALVDPSAALAAHVRLAVALGSRCVVWSPLDRVSAQPPSTDLEVVAAAKVIEFEPDPVFGQRLWP
jgi:hypothetical protein